MLSEDDVNLKELTRDELDAAWDLWFDLAQSTNDADPPYTHGVFVSAGSSSAGNVSMAPRAGIGRAATAAGGD